MRSKIQTNRNRAFVAQHGRCWYCGMSMWLKSPSELPFATLSPRVEAELRCTAEHLIAKSVGGRDTADNIVAACLKCNHTRHTAKCPLQPEAYRQHVRGRMAQGQWHCP